MNRSQFIVLLASINIVFMFTKIYHHNSMVRLMYQKQRSEQKVSDLKREYGSLKTHLLTVASLDTVKNKAVGEWTMKPISFAKIKLVETTLTCS